MSTPRILSWREAPIGWLVLDNPARHNAITLTMWEVMPEALSAFEADPEIRVVVVRGAGEKAFSTGADISEFDEHRSTAEQAESYARAARRAQAALADLRKPVLAMIRGHCMGGGLELALHCDIRIAADDAKFAIPAARIGLGYAYESVCKVVERIGSACAKQLLYTARRHDAGEALQMDLVNRVVPAAELEDAVREEALGIAANAPLTIAAAKLCIDTAVRGAEERDIEACRRAVQACFESEDYGEGRAAFAERRKPNFRGC